ncbi:SCAI-like protein [Mya arenaria]|uniref:SCAI-like protein n=1 Tax=Mya arenaria TaxID=6604 RepID=A0ABY7G8G1_MYAAR|nr:SCAI-like protein [Mya arenaria]
MADESIPPPPMDENEKRVVNEFCHLLEKSKQLFNGLRDLPQYGHKQWQSYFGRTFDVYTKQVLDTKYGLKRWQIGEVASKIGQLYYHYYLRTSETNYLNESFSFYSAIRMRAYYSKASKEERPDLMVKKLRFYARFIVVCLLLKKMKLVRDLVRELAKQIDDYTGTYEPEDHMEWNLVLGEIKAFIEEIIIVGNTHEQVKFSELTLDMFRMLQSLEREPQEDLSNQIYDASPAPGRQPFENGDRPGKRENPHKYLLYKPTYSQLNTFLASGFKELPPNGAMLLYISADGAHGNAKHTDDAAYDLGGVVTNSRREGEVNSKPKRVGTLKEMHCCVPDISRTGAHYHASIIDIPITLWDKCQNIVDKFLAETSKLFVRSRSIDHAYMQFIGDDFLRLLMLRFGPSFYPLSHPALPTEEILEHPTLCKIVLDLAVVLECRPLFAEPGEGDIHVCVSKLLICMKETGMIYMFIANIQSLKT